VIANFHKSAALQRGEYGIEFHMTAKAHEGNEHMASGHPAGFRFSQRFQYGKRYRFLLCHSVLSFF
jgi:hypothetical protein